MLCGTAGTEAAGGGGGGAWPTVLCRLDIFGTGGAAVGGAIGIEGAPVRGTGGALMEEWREMLSVLGAGIGTGDGAGIGTGAWACGGGGGGIPAICVGLGMVGTEPGIGGGTPIAGVAPP